MNFNSLPAMFVNSMTPGARPMADPSDSSLRRPVAEAVAAVQTYLNESPSLTGARIRCEEADDRIVLRGYVSTYSMKHIASM
jgi:hypothetical protein